MFIIWAISEAKNNMRRSCQPPALHRGDEPSGCICFLFLKARKNPNKTDFVYSPSCKPLRQSEMS